MIKKGLLLFILSLSSLTLISGEASFRSIYDDYYRSLVLAGRAEPHSLNYHSYSTDGARASLEGGPWTDVSYESSLLDSSYGVFSLIPPESWISWNSAVPAGGNDGAMWQGRGFNTRLSAGFSFRNDILSITIAPEYWAAQNTDFDTIPTGSSSGYGDYWTVFDNLQRYGDGFYDEFGWGQSEIRLTWKDYITAGFGNESIVIGPGQYNNILLSDNAGGFPHFDLGTPGFVDLGKWGRAEARGVWGYLHESEFFDEDDTNDRAWFSGSYIAYAPPFVPGLSLGLNYQYYKPLDEWDSWDLVRNVPGLDHSNSATDNKDMMVSLTFEWIFPDAGFSFYGEWGRNDNFGNIEDLITQPEHTQAFTFGFQQNLYRNRDRLLILSGEFSTLDQKRTYYLRAGGPWYRHGWSGWRQGFSNNGQLPGASIGPGSNSQIIVLQYSENKNSYSLEAGRIAHDEDYYYHLNSVGVTGINKWTTLYTAISYFRDFKGLRYFLECRLSLDYNNSFINDNEVPNGQIILGVTAPFR